MTEPSASPGPGGRKPEGFRWQAYFQHSSEPLFFLNRQRRLLFANRAWETLTGMTLGEMRGQPCKRRLLGPDAGLGETLGHLLAPPPEVLAGKPGRTRRLVPAIFRPDSSLPAQPPGRPWWDIAFFPFSAPAGLLGILGKISVVPREGLYENQPLPEKIITLRERRAQAFDLNQLAGETLAIMRVRAQVRLAGQTRVPIVLQGEPGTGKKWLARCIHQHSGRREGAFAAVDCLRLPSVALAEVLFGDGGLGRRLQLGTLYLLEPGHLPREMQDQLCRLVDTWSQEDKPGPSLLTGFRTAPEAEVQAGRLLPELLCRLSTLVIPLPTLRERLEDLPYLAEKLLARAQAASGQKIAGLTEEAWKVVRAYSWPGNIAELYQVLFGACLRAKGERIEAGDLPFHVRSEPAAKSRPLPLDALLEQVERRLIALALRQTRNNKTEAAELLSIWRQRLIRRMEALGIT